MSSLAPWFKVPPINLMNYRYALGLVVAAHLYKIAEERKRVLHDALDNRAGLE